MFGVVGEGDVVPPFEPVTASTTLVASADRSLGGRLSTVGGGVGCHFGLGRHLGDRASLLVLVLGRRLGRACRQRQGVKRLRASRFSAHLLIFRGISY